MKIFYSIFYNKMSSGATTSIPPRKSSIHRCSIPIKCEYCHIITGNDCGKCDKHCLCNYQNDFGFYSFLNQKTF